MLKTLISSTHYQLLPNKSIPSLSLLSSVSGNPLLPLTSWRCVQFFWQISRLLTWPHLNSLQYYPMITGKLKFLFIPISLNGLCHYAELFSTYWFFGILNNIFSITKTRTCLGKKRPFFDSMDDFVLFAYVKRFVRVFFCRRDLWCYFYISNLYSEPLIWTWTWNIFYPLYRFLFLWLL